MALSPVFRLHVAVALFVLITEFIDGIISSSPPNKSPDVCHTEKCKEAGAFFKARMNLSADPCENFYEYACGGWLKNNAIPGVKGSWTQFNVLREDVSKKGIKLLSRPTVTSPKSAVDNARAYFQTCVALDKNRDTGGIATLRRVISRFAGIKRLKPENKTRDWQLQLARLKKELGISSIISSWVAPDSMNNKVKKIQFDQPDFGLDRRTMVDHNKPSEKKRVFAYKKYMVKSFCLLYQGCEDDLKEEVKKEVDELFTFESQLAKFTAPPEEMRVISKVYKRRTIGELSKNIPEIRWKEYIKEIGSGTGQNFDDNTEVIVRGEQYYKKAAGFLKTTDNVTIVNYIAWAVLRHLGPFTTKAFRKNEFQMEKVLTGIKKPGQMKNRCYRLATNLMGYAVGSLYVKNHFSKESKSETKDLIKDLKTSMRALINASEWMDPITKKQANEKLEKFRDYIGFPSWILEDEELNKYYEMEPIDTNDFLRSHMRLLAFHAKKNILSLIHEDDPNREWGSSPAVVNAFYNAVKNSILFPAGILQPPFYYDNTLKVLNYGAIGFVIGHEITHAFDDKGSQYDGNGNLRNWWSNKTRSEFNKRKECFIQLYGSITDQQTKIKLNSKSTIGEDIADNGGIRQAFRAFSNSKHSAKRLPDLQLTPNQLFFVAAANVWCAKYRTETLRNRIHGDVHTPSMYRPVIPFSNEENFAKAFSCKIGSKMNPTKKCILW